MLLLANTFKDIAFVLFANYHYLRNCFNKDTFFFMPLFFKQLSQIFLATFCLQLCLISISKNAYSYNLYNVPVENNNPILTDSSFAFTPQKRTNCFIVVSKKDFYLYVYEKQNDDTVLLARYDCAVGRNAGNKIKNWDGRTPHCTDNQPFFTISEICNSKNWHHDFADGRGYIPAYGNWFLRLNIGTNNRTIGIHGSTNNEHTVPGRFSEGCVRLRDKDILSLKTNYAFVGMKVIVKGETEGDSQFEKLAFERLQLHNRRNF